MENKRLFWIKLPLDFFDRPEILYISAQKNGFEIISLFQRLIMKAADGEGYLRFSEAEPYTAETLAIVLRADKAVIETALNLFQRFQLIDILDNGTIRINDVEQYILSESIWAEKKRKQRARTKEGHNGDIVLEVSGQSPTDIDIDIDIESDIDKKEEKNITVDVSPRAHTRIYEEVIEFCRRKCPHIDGEGFWKYYDKRDWTINGEEINDWRAVALEWERQMIIDVNIDSTPTDTKIKLWNEYRERFGENVPAEYLGNVKRIKLAIATDTAIKTKEKQT